MNVRVLYHEQPEGWWAESPDIPSWTVAGPSYEEVRELVVDGVSFALAARRKSAVRDSMRVAFSRSPSSTSYRRPPDRLIAWTSGKVPAKALGQPRRTCEDEVFVELDRVLIRKPISGPGRQRHPRGPDDAS